MMLLRCTPLASFAQLNMKRRAADLSAFAPRRLTTKTVNLCSGVGMFLFCCISISTNPNEYRVKAIKNHHIVAIQILKSDKCTSHFYGRMIMPNIVSLLFYKWDRANKILPSNHILLCGALHCNGLEERGLNSVIALCNHPLSRLP